MNKKLLLSSSALFIFFLFIFITDSLSQTPQYYNANTGGIANTIPIGSTSISGYKTQHLILANEYNQPSPAPPVI